MTNQSKVAESSASGLHRWAVFLSGHGSNLQALLDAQPKLSISLVVSNKPDAFGLQRARQHEVPILVLPQPIDWQDLSQQLKQLSITRIFLAGFMKVIPASFIQEWPDSILNLHPSLLPSYKGLRAIERSYQDGAAMGVTIHWVTADLDAGPPLLQREVFAAGSASTYSLEQVTEAIHRVENEMVVEAVRRCQ